MPAFVWGLIGLMIAVLSKSSAFAIGHSTGDVLVVGSLIGVIAMAVARFAFRARAITS